MNDNTKAAASALGTNMGEEDVLVSEQSQQSLRNRRSAGHENDQQHNNLRWELLDMCANARLPNKERALEWARFFWNGRQDDMAAVWASRAQDLGATEAELQQICSNSPDDPRRTERAIEAAMEALTRCLVGDIKNTMTRVSDRLFSPPEQRKENKWKDHNE